VIPLFHIGNRILGSQLKQFLVSHHYQQFCILVLLSLHAARVRDFLFKLFKLCVNFFIGRAGRCFEQMQKAVLKLRNEVGDALAADSLFYQLFSVLDAPEHLGLEVVDLVLELVFSFR
jgi:hypothetical protein